MDIERMKKLLKSGIEAGNKLKAVREVVKTYKTQKQDMYDDTEELFKPSIEVQKQVKKTIDEKQNKLIEQLQENKETVDKKQDEVIKQLKDNQVELIKSVDALSDIMSQQGSQFQGSQFGVQKWLRDIDEGEDKGEDEGEDEEINIDEGINDEYKNFLINKNLPLPSEILKEELDEIQKKVKQKIRTSKKYISENSTTKGTPYKKLTPFQKSIFYRNKNELLMLNDYLTRFNYIKNKFKSTGKGIYTQKKRNAYKISKGGNYGGIVIDLPKLFGHLKVVAHKNGQKVYDRKADFVSYNF